ncbi:MAG: hypothetical protein IT581_22445 [Verrucomicrobiales bacterium]|nr:hypothetical protein [Verrucomicrobiales bacterium]
MPSLFKDRRAALAGLVLLLAGAGQGCRLAQTAVELPSQAVRLATPGKKAATPLDPVELQQDILRLADDFANSVVAGVDRLRRANEPLSQAESLQFKLAVVSQTHATATSPHPFAALVDLTVFVTVFRKTLENDVQSAAFGDSVRFLAEGCRSAEAELWQLARHALRPEHLTELQSDLDRWQHREIDLQDILTARADGKVTLLPELDPSSKGRPESVFGLLGVDPLSGVDPAVREVARTRLFAERAMFITQRLPRLLRWQTELLALHATELPAIQQLIANSTDITTSLNRFARVAEKLPDQVSQERAEILRALESQEARLNPLVQEVRQALLAGSQMSTSLTSTLITFDALMKRFGVGETNASSSASTNSNSEPFRIQDYGNAAQRIEGAARELRGLLGAVNETLGSSNLTELPARVAPAVQHAQDSGRDLVNYAFRKGVQLIGIALAAALAFRFVAVRMLPIRPSPKAP